MKRIYKYPITVDDKITLSLPLGAKILTVQMQKTCPCLWVMVDPDLPKVERRFCLYGTGMEVKDNPFYIGSFQMLGGDLIFHLFELP